jgi:hypothetical protein
MGGRLGPDIRAVFFRGHSIELGLLVEGIPSEPLRDITAREVREDGELLVRNMSAFLNRLLGYNKNNVKMNVLGSSSASAGDESSAIS